MKKALKDSWWIWAVRLLPFLLIAAGILLFGRRLRGMSVEDILQYTPANAWLAALVLIGFYAVKSLSVVFPLLVLYLVRRDTLPASRRAAGQHGGAARVHYGAVSARPAGRPFLYRPHDRALCPHTGDQRPQGGSRPVFLFFSAGDQSSARRHRQHGARGLPHGFSAVCGGLHARFAAHDGGGDLSGESITDWTSPKFYLSLSAVVLLSAVSFLGYRHYVRRRPPQ